MDPPRTPLRNPPLANREATTRQKLNSLRQSTLELPIEQSKMYATIKTSSPIQATHGYEDKNYKALLLHDALKKIVRDVHQRFLQKFSRRWSILARILCAEIL